MILGAHVSIAGGVSNAPLSAQNLGIFTFQIFTKNQTQWRAKPLDPKEIDSYLQRCEEANICCVVAHDSYLINLCAVDETKLAKSRQALQIEMMRADQLQIPYLVMHPGSHLGAGEDAGIRLLAESYRMYFDKYPDGKARILLETTAGQGTNLGYKFEQIAEMLRLIENDDRMGVCLDTCHIFAAGYDFRTSDGYHCVMDDFSDKIGLDRLYAIHLNDSKRDIGSRVDRHEHIGDGKIGLEPFSYFINDPRFRNIPALLETPGGMEGYERNLKILDKLGVTEPNSSR